MKTKAVNAPIKFEEEPSPNAVTQTLVLTLTSPKTTFYSRDILQPPTLSLPLQPLFSQVLTSLQKTWYIVATKCHVYLYDGQIFPLVVYLPPTQAFFNKRVRCSSLPTWQWQIECIQWTLDSSSLRGSTVVRTIIVCTQLAYRVTHGLLSLYRTKLGRLPLKKTVSNSPSFLFRWKRLTPK